MRGEERRRKERGGKGSGEGEEERDGEETGGLAVRLAPTTLHRWRQTSTFRPARLTADREMNGQIYRIT